jgi:hypothetical protein
LNAILILIGMFSLTIFISNLGFLNKVRAFSFLSIPLAIGILCSPDGLIPILPSTREDLSWSLKVALTWTTFLAGIQLTHNHAPRWQQFKKLLPIFLGYILFFLISLMLISLFASHIAVAKLGSEYSMQAIALALLISSALFSSEENPFLLAIIFISLFWVFSEGKTQFIMTDLAYPLLIGLIMGVICRLIISPHTSLDSPTRLTLVGLCILGTGWAVGMESLEVLVGLSLGWALSFIHKYGICDDPKLKSTDTPIRFIIALFAGLYIHLSITVLFTGLLLAIFRLLIKFLLLNTGLRRAEDFEILHSLLPIAKLALPITLSLHLSKYGGDSTQFVLGTFVVGFITNDILTLLFELYKRRTISLNETTA